MSKLCTPFLTKVRHVAEEHQHLVVVCHICDQVLQTDLDKHLPKHEGRKKLQCEDCDKFTFTRPEMNFHRTTVHNDLSVPHYQCEYCKKYERSKINLAEHINAVHTQKHLYKCPKCDYTTFRKRMLVGHDNFVHKKKIQTICQYCGMGFRGHKKSNYHTHMKNCHPNMPK